MDRSEDLETSKQADLVNWEIAKEPDDIEISITEGYELDDINQSIRVSSSFFKVLN